MRSFIFRCFQFMEWFFLLNFVLLALSDVEPASEITMKMRKSFDGDTLIFQGGPKIVLGNLVQVDTTDNIAGGTCEPINIAVFELNTTNRVARFGPSLTRRSPTLDDYMPLGFCFKSDGSEECVPDHNNMLTDEVRMVGTEADINHFLDSTTEGRKVYFSPPPDSELPVMGELQFKLRCINLYGRPLLPPYKNDQQITFNIEVRKSTNTKVPGSFSVTCNDTSSLNGNVVWDKRSAFFVSSTEFISFKCELDGDVPDGDLEVTITHCSTETLIFYGMDQCPDCPEDEYCPVVVTSYMSTREEFNTKLSHFGVQPGYDGAKIRFSVCKLDTDGNCNQTGFDEVVTFVRKVYEYESCEINNDCTTNICIGDTAGTGKICKNCFLEGEPCELEDPDGCCNGICSQQETGDYKCSPSLPVDDPVNSWCNTNDDFLQTCSNDQSGHGVSIGLTGCEDERCCVPDDQMLYWEGVNTLVACSSDRAVIDCPSVCGALFRKSIAPMDNMKSMAACISHSKCDESIIPPEKCVWPVRESEGGCSSDTSLYYGETVLLLCEIDSDCYRLDNAVSVCDEGSCFVKSGYCEWDVHCLSGECSQSGMCKNNVDESCLVNEDCANKRGVYCLPTASPDEKRCTKCSRNGQYPSENSPCCSGYVPLDSWGKCQCLGRDSPAATNWCDEVMWFGTDCCETYMCEHEICIGLMSSSCNTVHDCVHGLECQLGKCASILPPSHAQGSDISTSLSGGQVIQTLGLSFGVSVAIIGLMSAVLAIIGCWIIYKISKMSMKLSKGSTSQDSFSENVSEFRGTCDSKEVVFYINPLNSTITVGGEDIELDSICQVVLKGTVMIVTFEREEKHIVQEWIVERRFRKIVRDLLEEC